MKNYKKGRNKKYCVNIESALEDDLKSDKGKITKGKIIKNGRNKKDCINVVRALEADLKSVVKGKITPGQKVKKIGTIKTLLLLKE